MGAAIPPGQDVLPELQPSGSAAGRLVVHRGFTETNGLAMYEAMFDVADDHVYIVNDFPIVAALERAIHRLLAREVSVKLLIGSATARRDDGTFFPAPLHRTLFEYMVKGKLEPLLLAGVEVYEFVPAAFSHDRCARRPHPPLRSCQAGVGRRVGDQHWVGQSRCDGKLLGE